jgi:fatty acid-binding protein DegV
MSLSATRSTSSATLGASQLAPLRNGGRVVAVKATSAYSEVSPTLILLALV